MGNKNSTQVKNVMNATSEQIFKSITQVKNECVQNTQASNTFDINVKDPCKELNFKTDAGKNACISALSKSQINISNITQDQDINAVASCTFTSEETAKINDKIIENLKQKAKSEEDGFTKALNGITNPGGTSGSNILNETNLKKVIDTELETDFYNGLSQNLQTDNIFNFLQSSAQNTNISNVTQYIKLEAIAKSLNKTSKLTDKITEVDQTMQQEGESEQKGVTNIVDSVIGFFTNGQNLSMVAIGIIALVLIVFLISFFATGGQQTLREGMHRGANIANARANPLGKMGGDRSMGRK